MNRKVLEILCSNFNPSGITPPATWNERYDGGDNNSANIWLADRDFATAPGPTPAGTASAGGSGSQKWQKVALALLGT
jgi:hypothetical protein